MNIFYLDSDPRRCASYHCDKHVVKMVVESCQLLSNALPEDKAPYRRTHYNHPCSKWVRESWSNWWWAYQLTYHLLMQWKIRYHKDDGKTVGHHKCCRPLINMGFDVLEINDDDFEGTHHTKPPQCMPDEFRQDNTVQAYREYYMVTKSYFATWKNQKPYWYPYEKIKV